LSASQINEMDYQNVIKIWDEWFRHVDKRVDTWPLMSSPWPCVSIVIFYVLTVHFGRIWMRDREPYDVKIFLIVYNIVLVALSAYMTGEIFRQAYFVGGYSWVCNGIDKSDKGIGLARVIWIFFVSKFLETFDTIIMLLRKKEDQISFLHVYHHCSVIILWWIGARFVPGGDSYWSSMQNSFVHTVMYTYYLFAALGIPVWWKKYITKLQMGQFFLNIVHTSVGLIKTDCGDIPLWMGRGMIMYMSSLLVLFGHFYIKAYWERQENGKKENGKKENGKEEKRKKEE